MREEDGGSSPVSESRTTPTLQGRLAKRFKILRLLRQDQPFVVVVLIGLLVGAVVLLSVPKLWRTTPAGFPYGEVKVSVVDRIQAWSLRRTAERAEAAGNSDAAQFAWRGALANNMADPALHRGILRFLGRTSNAPPDQAGLAIQSAMWLSALGGTNAPDLALVGSVLERLGRPSMALGFLSGRPEARDPQVDRIRARCLFSAGMADAFAAEWRSNAVVWALDPIQALYQDAWLALTDDRTAGLEAAVRLKESMTDPGERGLTAARLLGLVSSLRQQADDLGLALGVLEARGSASAAQHGLYWKLLAAAGRTDEARRLAKAYDRVPRDPEVAARHWLALRDIGMRDEALVLAERHLGAYRGALEVWRAYFDLLADAGRWTDIRRAAVDARMLCGKQDPLFVELTFAEYRASIGEGRASDGARIARELAELRFVDLEALIRVSAALRGDERWAESMQLLKAYEGSFREQTGYWSELFSAGLGAKELEVLRRAVDELTRIEPKNVAWMNNRAALLLITGENPAEALRLTLEGRSRYPGSMMLRINHALALLANGRAAEAEGVLAGVQSARLPKDAAANYFLAKAEIESALGRSEQAVEAASKVDATRLMKPQVDRLERILRGAPVEKRTGA